MNPLHIEPSQEVHFWLNDDEPKCSMTMRLKNLEPVAFRIQPSERQRYAIWPSVGIVQPGNEISISIVLLENARRKLKGSFAKMGPLAEFRQMDKIIIEWCKAPQNVCDQIHDDEDQDFEILSTFWNTKGYALYAPVMASQMSMRVRFSDENLSETPGVIPTISTDESSSAAESSEDVQQIPVSQQHTRDNGSPHDNEPMHPIGNIEPLSTPTETNQSSSSTHIERRSLEDALRCGGCDRLFSRNPTDTTIPILSRSCGHTACRECVTDSGHTRSTFKRSAGQRLKPCPLCKEPNAFGGSYDINHSLCAVIALLG